MELGWKGIIGMTVGCIFIFGLMFSVVDEAFRGAKENKACKDLGMDKHKGADFGYCIEDNGETHYVKFICNGLLWNKECTIKYLTVGVVRIVTNS